MNPFVQMEQNKNDYTKKELIVYNLFINHVDEVIRNPLSTLAEDYNISQSTITRFCQKLGYQGYSDFKFDFYRYQKKSSEVAVDQGLSVTQLYAKLILLLDTSVNDKQLQSFSEDILGARSVIIAGQHKSAIPARMLQINLMKLGINAHSVESDIYQEVPSFITDKDLLIVFSVEGLSCKPLITAVSEKNVKIALVTMNNRNTQKNLLAHYFYLPSSKNQQFDKYLESQIINLVFADMVTARVANVLTTQ